MCNMFLPLNDVSFFSLLIFCGRILVWLLFQPDGGAALEAPWILLHFSLGACDVGYVVYFRSCSQFSTFYF